MTTPVVPGPQVVVNPDGSWDLPCRVRFQNPLDIVNTGVGTLTILPVSDGSGIAQGIAQFVPLLGRGQPGFTPNLNTTVNLIELAPGANPPSGTPTASWALSDPGNEDTPPTWQLTLYIHRGNDGSFIMPLLQDLSNVVGSLINGATLVFDAITGQWNVQDPHLVQFAACTSFTAADGTQPKQQIGQLTLPQSSYARQVKPEASCIVTPAADGTTPIKIYARLGSTTGPIIGQSLTLPNPTTPFIAHVDANTAAADPDNQIAAGASATVYLMAELQSNSNSAWSTTMVDATYTALGIPVN